MIDSRISLLLSIFGTEMFEILLAQLSAKSGLHKLLLFDGEN
jgi:hypothetical protein